MSLPSVTQRQELLDLLEDVLRYPEKYGDHFFRDGVKNSKDGMVLISFLHSLALEVGNFPIKYIQYCAPLDIKTRFRLSQDEKEIGLFDHPYNEETDRYGFIKQLDDEEQGTKDAFDSLSNEESNKGSTSNATESGNVKIKKSGSKMAYTPSIFSQLLETGSVQPTIYSDGKFYIDNEHYEQHDSIEGASKFEYDIPNIEPLGISAPINPFRVPNSCFNCGEVKHKINKCPIPINKERVERNKRNMINDSLPSGKRLHTELELEDRVSKMVPGVLSDSLSDALGMTSPDQKPPYYSNMKWYGYPPGYLGKEGEDYSIKLKLKLEDVPTLKIYDDNYVDSDQEEMELDTNDNDRWQQNDQYQQIVQLVHYPGLDLMDTSRLDRHMDTINNQAPPLQPPQSNDEQWQLEQQYWRYYNYVQQYPHLQQQQHYYDTSIHYYHDESSQPLGTVSMQSTQEIAIAIAISNLTTSDDGATSNTNETAPRAENPIWAILQQRRQAQANFDSNTTVSSIPVVDYDDDQGEDMDISSDDDG